MGQDHSFLHRDPDDAKGHHHHHHHHGFCPPCCERGRQSDLSPPPSPLMSGRHNMEEEEEGTRKETTQEEEEDDERIGQRRPFFAALSALKDLHGPQLFYHPMEDVTDTYIMSKELGHGQFGKTYLCINRKTKEQFACKTISKRKLLSREDVEDVRREVQILHHVTGQPNIIQLQGTYEDKEAIHLVMELCEGGELFDRIIEKGRYTERGAASLCRTIVEVVSQCHSLGVMHRDLKPENFLFLSKAEDSPLKCIDFGLSVFFKPGQVFQDVVGSAYYIAPEVLKRNYGPEADVWSVGVILYILLSGFPPFWAETEQGIFKEILVGDIDFMSDPWPTISSGAKDLIKKILIQDPKKRVSVLDVLNHPWIRVDGEAADKLLDNVVLTRLKKFRDMNKLKKLTLQVIAERLSEEEITGLKELFKSIDTDNSETITFDELKQGLARLGANLAESEVRQLMEAADLDGSGTIDYIEFIGATIHMSKANRDKQLHEAFRYFDKDDSGYITVEELDQALREHHMRDSTAIDDIIADVDTDHDGKINYSEFVAMMRKGEPPARPRGI